MSSEAKISVNPLSIGERVAWHRRRRGLSRRALAELVGRTSEWLRLLEIEGRGAERLTALVDLARALNVDLAALVGRPVMTRGAEEIPTHPAVPEVRMALSRALLAPGATSPCSVPALQERVNHAWTAWRVSREQYTALGLMLPGLLTDAICAARTVTPGERQRMHQALAHAYLLAQRFAFCVGATDLAAQCTDRAMLAADAADDPELLALTGWASAMTSLAARRPGDAAEIALYACSHVTAASTRRAAALRGSLLLFAAMGMKTVSDMLGHSGIAITADTYSSVADELKRVAADKIADQLALDDEEDDDTDEYRDGPATA